MNLPIPKEPRVLAPVFIDWIKTLACIVCQAPDPHPHHIIGHGFGGGALKADDYLTIPLCNCHHTGEKGVHKGHESWEKRWGCQLQMCVRTLLYAFYNQVITSDTCQTYLFKLEPKVGMDYIIKIVGSYQSKREVSNEPVC